MAIGAMALEPFLNTPEDAVWWSMLALPAVYGALTVFPIASMAKDHFGKGAGVLAAWLIAFMPAHVLTRRGRSPTTTPLSCCSFRLGSCTGCGR